MQPEHRAQPGSQPGGWGSGQPAGQPAARQAGQPVGSSVGQGVPASGQQPPSFPPQIDPKSSGGPTVPPASSRVTVPGYPSGPAAPAEEKVDTGPLPSRETLRREAQAASSRRGAGDADVERAAELLTSVANIFSQRVVGQEQLRTALVTALMSSGHILLESVPGLAKTTAAQTLASAVSGSFRRIQCTPDLMPNDIVGTRIWNQAQNEMTTELGPVHANIVLLDEINRSSAKTQSAMLEAMQEGQTTIGGTVYPLPKPFMVMATQNPIEEEGTYVLPEAQMDRFLMKEIITYPQPLEELEVLNRIDSGSMDKPIDAEPITLEELTFLQQMTRRIFLHDTLKAYIVDLINTTRGMGPNPLPGFSQHVRVGASPRGGIALMRVSQAVALMQGRNYVMPEDIKKLRHPILRHRIIRTFDAMADDISVDGLIDAVFSAVAVP